MQASKLRVGQEYGISRYSNFPERGRLVEIEKKDAFRRGRQDVYCVFNMLNTQTGMPIESSKNQRIRARDVAGPWAEVAEEAKRRDEQHRLLQAQRQENLRRMKMALVILGFRDEEIAEGEWIPGGRKAAAKVWASAEEHHCYVRMDLEQLEQVATRRAREGADANS